jgi:hypothetical protein
MERIPASIRGQAGLRGSTLFLRSNLERMLLQHDLLW